MSDITKIKDIPVTIMVAIGVIRRGAKYLIIPTGIIIFFPDTWLNKMQLLKIKTSSFGMWISIVFWVCISIVIIDILTKNLKNSLENKKKHKKFTMIMNTLTDSEKDIIYKIHKHDKYKFDAVGDASATKLKSFKIIYCSTIGSIGSGFSCGLEQRTREFIKKNPSYLSEYAKEQHENLKKAIKDLEQESSRYDYYQEQTIENLEYQLKEYE